MRATALAIVDIRRTRFVPSPPETPKRFETQRLGPMKGPKMPRAQSDEDAEVLYLDSIGTRQSDIDNLVPGRPLLARSGRRLLSSSAAGDVRIKGPLRALAFKWIRICCRQNRTPCDESTYLNALNRRGSPLLIFERREPYERLTVPRRAWAGWVSYARKPTLVDPDNFDHLLPDTKAQISQLVRQLAAIDQVDRRSTVTRCLLHSGRAEHSRRDEQALVGSPDHGATEIPNLARRHRPLVSLALKQDVEAHESMGACYPTAIDAAIAAATGDLDLSEPGLAEQTLNKPLKRCRRKLLCQDGV
jgi:hypothetical protein